MQRTSRKVTQRRKGVIQTLLCVSACRRDPSERVGGLCLILATSHLLHRYRDDRLISSGPVVRDPVPRLGITI